MKGEVYDSKKRKYKKIQRFSFLKIAAITIIVVGVVMVVIQSLV
jgi:hypothetical protein